MKRFAGLVALILAGCYESEQTIHHTAESVASTQAISVMVVGIVAVIGVTCIVYAFISRR